MINIITLLLFKAQVQGGHSDILVYTCMNKDFFKNPQNKF